MKTKIYKKPRYENDTALVEFNDLYVHPFDKLGIKDEYTILKYNKFLKKDITKNGFEKFKDRPSLRNIDEVLMFQGSIYTHTCEERNFVNYEMLKEMIRKLIERKSRRCVVVFANNFSDYFVSENVKSFDVSCLNLIHYYDDQVRIVFRASDVQNELFTDFATICEFFIRPIYNKPVSISLFLSTVQNHKTFDKAINSIKKIYGNF